MKHTLIRIIILIALFVNISHDAVIAIGDRHANEPVFEYVLEQTQKSSCGHTGEYHSFFHFAAILTTLVPPMEKIEKIKPIIAKIPLPITQLTRTPIKPPIA